MSSLTVFPFRPGYRLLPALGLLLGAGCCIHPITSALDYPLSLVMAPVFALLFLIWGANSARSGDPQVAKGPWLLLLATWLLSLVGPAIRSAFGSVCEPLYGLGFLILGPLASGACGLAAGLALRRWVNRRSIRIMAVVFIVLGELTLILVEFWFTPSVRFYGWLFGLYHGAIYDEAVRIDGPYLWLRLKDLLWIIALLLWMRPPVKSESRFPVRRFYPWVALGGAIILLAFSPWLRFTATSIPVEQTLSSEVSSAHFNLYATPGGKALKLLPRLAEDLEFRLWQQQRQFGLQEPSSPIRVFVYESPLQKEALMGAGRTTISKPWRKEIHFNLPKPGDSLVAHELAHALLADLSSSMLAVPSTLGVIPKPGILEGAATAAERGGYRLTNHGWARAMRDLGKLPEMEAILSGLSFWGHSGALAYTACGSFLRFLLETYGPVPFASLYGGAEFEQAYSMSLGDLLKQWNLFLDGVAVSDADRLLAEFVFTQPSVFQKTCPHAGARCVQDVGLAIRGEQVDEAVALARRALMLTEGDPRVGKEVGTLLLAANATAQARDILGANPGLNNIEKAAKSVQMALTLWDLDTRWLLGQGRAASEGYLLLAQDTNTQALMGVELSWRRLLSQKATSRTLRRLVIAPVLDKEMSLLVGELLAVASELGAVDRAALGRALLAQPRWEEDALSLLRPLVIAGMPEWLLQQTSGMTPHLTKDQACCLYLDLTLRLATTLIFKGDLEQADGLLESLTQSTPAALQRDETELGCITPGAEEAIADLQQRTLWKRQYLGENQEGTKQEE